MKRLVKYHVHSLEALCWFSLEDWNAPHTAKSKCLKKRIAVKMDKIRKF
jgi:hypothetical protein